VQIVPLHLVIFIFKSGSFWATLNEKLESERWGNGEGGGIIKKAREKKGRVITKCTRIGLEKEKA